MKTRKTINFLDLLIDCCLPESQQEGSGLEEEVNDSNSREMWKDCLESYRKAISMIRTKADLNDDEVCKVQIELDVFFRNGLI